MEHILSEEFLNTYRNMKTPLKNIGEFVYLRTYSRYLEDKKRRETWFETVLRATEYNIRLGIDYKRRNGLDIDLDQEVREAELLFDNLFNLRTFTSGRTLYMGGTGIVENYPLSNYNCAFTEIEGFHDLVDVFYLLMVGSGVGVRISKEKTGQLPPVRKTLLESFYDPGVRLRTGKEDMEHTMLRINGDLPSKARIVVGDSKEGWCDALDIYFKLLTLDEYSDIRQIAIDYSYVRPEGERLKRFGGRASGHKSIERMFEKINRTILRSSGNRLKTIDILDMATIISENVVSGGVRRSAMMIICDEDDEDIINAKRGMYKLVDGEWTEDSEISHRKMSNNSIIFFNPPSPEKIREVINSIRINGEPGFINAREALRRKDGFGGCNPCGEILLKPRQCCNLTTNNLMAFAGDGSLDEERLKEILRLSTRVAIRMTLVDVELPEWNKVMQEDRIIGVSLTGMIDMVNRTGMDYDELGALLGRLRETVHEEGLRYSRQLNINAPKLMTTIKPEGSLSNLPGVSSGIHFAHSQYYIRRVRISASDPLYRLIAAQGSYPVYNETGQTDDNATIKVIEFPMKAPEGRTKYDVGAIEQLKLYKMSMENWSDHNTSITVHVRDHEWEEVASWIYDNFDSIVGITLLPLADETYPLLPYECTTREDYEERISRVRPIDTDTLALYDNDDIHDILDNECETGACPVR